LPFSAIFIAISEPFCGSEPSIRFRTVHSVPVLERFFLALEPNRWERFVQHCLASQAAFISGAGASVGLGPTGAVVSDCALSLLQQFAANAATAVGLNTDGSLPLSELSFGGTEEIIFSETSITPYSEQQAIKATVLTELTGSIEFTVYLNIYSNSNPGSTVSLNTETDGLGASLSAVLISRTES